MRYRHRHTTDVSDLRRGERLVAGLAGVDDLVEEAVKQSEHHDDEVIGRRLYEHLAAESDEVEAWLDKPVEQIAQHVAVLLRHCDRQLHNITQYIHTSCTTSPPATH